MSSSASKSSGIGWRALTSPPLSSPPSVVVVSSPPSVVVVVSSDSVVVVVSSGATAKSSPSMSQVSSAMSPSASWISSAVSAASSASASSSALTDVAHGVVPGRRPCDLEEVVGGVDGVFEAFVGAEVAVGDLVGQRLEARRRRRLRRPLRRRRHIRPSPGARSPPPPRLHVVSWPGSVGHGSPGDGGSTCGQA